jgi:hypothetical protein
MYGMSLARWLLVGFAGRIDLSICGLAPEEQKGNLGARRVAL